MRDTPAFGRLVVATVGWPGVAAVVPELPPGWLPRHLCCSPDEPITLPTATIFVDVDEWGACAHSLGRTGSALFAGLVARLANEWDGTPQTARSRLGDAGQRARRRRYSRQRLHDVYITVDRALATTDLREIRDAVKQALTGPQDLRDEVSAIRSLGPGRGQSVDSPFRRSAVRVLGNCAGTGLCFGHCLSAGPYQLE